MVIKNYKSLCITSLMKENEIARILVIKAPRPEQTTKIL